VAERVLAFGDEASTLTPDGRKYSVNALNDDGSLACEREPIWTQSIANIYGFVFAECNPNSIADPRATTLAAAGAQVANLSAQIDTAEISPGFAQRTMATVMIGTNDILALYAEFPVRDEADLTTELEARGTVVGQQVNRLVDRGVRVLIATVPSLGLSPFGLAERLAHGDTDRAALLNRLTAAFNAAIRTTIYNDGRKLGLVLADELVQVLSENPGSYKLSNVILGACTVELPNCNSNTLIVGATSATWLWADDHWLAYGGQNQLGSLARGRAQNNPF